MDFVIMSVTLQVADCLLPVSRQDILILSSESLMNLRRAGQLASGSAAWQPRKTNIGPGSGVEFCGRKALRGKLYPELTQNKGSAEQTSMYTNRSTGT